MKKSVIFLGLLTMALRFSSCEKEVIEIVEQKEELNFDIRTSSTEGDDSNINTFGNVTDPNEDEDFDADKKNNVGSGQ